MLYLWLLVVAVGVAAGGRDVVLVPPPSSAGKLKVLRLSLAFPLPLSADFKLRKMESAEAEAEVLVRVILSVGVDDAASVEAAAVEGVYNDASVGMQGVDAESNVGTLARDAELEPVDMNDLTGRRSISGLLRDVSWGNMLADVEFAAPEPCSEVEGERKVALAMWFETQYTACEAFRPSFEGLGDSANPPACSISSLALFDSSFASFGNAPEPVVSLRVWGFGVWGFGG